MPPYLHMRNGMMNDLVGTTLANKYQLTRVLGRGGMGIVYEAEHVVLGHKVAIKALHRTLGRIDASKERFLREARAAAAIGHPNIIDIIDFGEEEDGTFYIVMQLLKGISLETLIQRGEQIVPERAVEIALQVLSALHAAHAAGIIHRDLKPDNVFLSETPSGATEVKLLDFGIAKFQRLPEDEELKLTQAGTVVGTPTHLSPEQARGQSDFDHRVDLWSTGILLYEMLTGQLPFRGDNYNEVLSSILLDPHPPASQAAPHIPPGLVAVIDRALAKHPDDRYASAQQMMADLLPFYDFETEHLRRSVVLSIGNSLPEDEIGEGMRTQLFRPSRRIKAAVFLKDTLGRRSNERRTRLLAAMGVAATTLAVVGIAWAVSRYDHPVGDEQRRDVPSVAQTSSPASSSPRGGASIQPPSRTATVLEVTGIPKEAIVFIDGRPVPNPTRLPRSNTPVSVIVRSAGFEDVALEVVPDRDRAVEITLRPLAGEAVLPKDAKHDKNRTESPSGTQKHNGKLWMKNPFGQ